MANHGDWFAEWFGGWFGAIQPAAPEEEITVSRPLTSPLAGRRRSGSVGFKPYQEPHQIVWPPADDEEDLLILLL